ncbi:MAG: M28 family peptidase [Gemmatimonadota bacterium]|nr:MAG: M28 family peptidase [Gemmatimonadota bacterium]
MRWITGLILVAIGCGAGGRGPREFDGEAALGYVETQLAFGPRVPNTEGHRQTGDWILEQLRLRADSVEVQEFTHVTVDGDTLHLRNFIGRFRPEVSERILYLAHWDTRPRADRDANLGRQRLPVPGANDGASGVAVLLGVADVLERRPSDFGVDLLFVDGEDYGDFAQGADVLLGSRHYAASVDAGAFPLYAVVWDMVGDRDLEIYQEGNSVTRAPEVVDRVWSRARDLGYSRVFRPSVGYTMTDDHVPLLEVGIRAIDVIDFDYPHWHTADDTLDKVSAASLQVVGDVAVALLR